jgi:hypothetical protein
LDELPTITHSVFEYEGGLSAKHVCVCGNPGEFRCRDCWKSPHCCLECLLVQHYRHPFHQPEKFNGQYYEQQEWADLGLVIGLEHDWEIATWCPHHHREAIPKRLTVVHINGMHTLLIHPCQCPHSPSFISQLCRHGLFPVTVADASRLGTVFTFQVLEDYQLHMLTLKTSAYDYCEALARRTNPVLPHTIPVCLELRCMMTTNRC